MQSIYLPTVFHQQDSCYGVAIFHSGVELNSGYGDASSIEFRNAAIAISLVVLKLFHSIQSKEAAPGQPTSAVKPGPLFLKQIEVVL
jgi:hypothetical protein